MFIVTFTLMSLFPKKISFSQESTWVQHRCSDVSLPTSCCDVTLIAWAKMFLSQSTTGSDCRARSANQLCGFLFFLAELYESVWSTFGVPPLTCSVSQECSRWVCDNIRTFCCSFLSVASPSCETKQLHELKLSLDLTADCSLKKCEDVEVVWQHQSSGVQLFEPPHSFTPKQAKIW